MGVKVNQNKMGVNVVKVNQFQMGVNVVQEYCNKT